jgi:hypothetical protein
VERTNLDKGGLKLGDFGPAKDGVDVAELTIRFTLA